LPNRFTTVEFQGIVVLRNPARHPGSNGSPAALSVLVLPPPSLYRKLFSPQSEARLRAVAGRLEVNGEDRDVSSAELARRIGEFDVLVTGWRSPRLDAGVLAAARQRPLKLVAHSAGSVKFLFDDEPSMFGSTFAITTAAAAMGPTVAEMALQALMMLLRPLHVLDRGMKDGGDWRDLKAWGSQHQRELTAQRVGVIGAGHTGRHFCRMLRALGVHTIVYDPYLDASRAADMDVERVETLDELLTSSTAVALHAPATPETRHMIGRRELALLPDGAVFVNTARPSLVDDDALLAELRNGRISAALDVFTEEPLPADSPFRRLDNVLLTPHIASHTSQCYYRQGDCVVEEVCRLAHGEPLRYAVTPEMLPTMA
jgi:phosphoglycerate dehydrogenase-like enzyme